MKINSKKVMGYAGEILIIAAGVTVGLIALDYGRKMVMKFSAPKATPAE